MRIDAHQHFWKISKGYYDWLTPDIPLIYRDFLPIHLKPILRKHSIDKTIIIQAAPKIEETKFLLELAAEEEFIAGVVGWLDMETEDFEEQFYKMRQNPKFIGLRPMIQNIKDNDWVLKPRVIHSFRIIEKEDFPFDFLIYPRHLPYILQLLKKCPKLRGVINHLAKPQIKKQQMEPWANLINDLAKYPNIMCKLSGFVTKENGRSWNLSEFIPYINHVLDVFGFKRVIFGSDWPVLLRATSYSNILYFLREMLGKKLTPEIDAAIFGRNAVRFYKLNVS